MLQCGKATFPYEAIFKRGLDLPASFNPYAIQFNAALPPLTGKHYATHSGQSDGCAIMTLNDSKAH